MAQRSLIAGLLLPTVIGGLGLFFTSEDRKWRNFDRVMELVNAEDPDQQALGVALADELMRECREKVIPFQLTCDINQRSYWVIKSIDSVRTLARESAMPDDVITPSAALETPDAVAAPEADAAEPETIRARVASRAVITTGQAESAVVAAAQEAYGKDSSRSIKLVESLRPRIFVQIRNESDRAAARSFMAALRAKALDANVDVEVLGPELIAGRQEQTQLRYLKNTDEAQAKEIALLLEDMGCNVGAPVDLTARYDADARVRNRTYEIWFSSNAADECLKGY